MCTSCARRLPGAGLLGRGGALAGRLAAGERAAAGRVLWPLPAAAPPPRRCGGSLYSTILCSSASAWASASINVAGTAVAGSVRAAVAEAGLMRRRRGLPPLLPPLARALGLVAVHLSRMLSAMRAERSCSSLNASSTTASSASCGGGGRGADSKPARRSAACASASDSTTLTLASGSVPTMSAAV